MRVIVAGGGTGGHLMPALALADELADRAVGAEPVMVGAIRGLEATILPKRVPAHRFYLLPILPFYRRTWWKNVAWLGAAPRVWRQCGRILAEERPRLVISTGGYAAGPIAYRAARRGIPLVLQEQNALPGVTSRWLSPYAREIYLGFPEARDRIGATRAEFVTLGNPTAVTAGDREAARRALGIPLDARVVFVMCGSQGARTINQVVGKALDEGALGETHVLWACGLGNVDTVMPYHRPPKVIVRPFWDPVAEAYHCSDLAVTRAGAMTSAELTALGLPAIMIPLPTAAEGHQLVNARALEAAGAVICLPESDVSASSLSQSVDALLGDSARLAAMGRASRGRGNPSATKDIVDRIVRLLD